MNLLLIKFIDIVLKPLISVRENSVSLKRGTVPEIEKYSFVTLPPLYPEEMAEWLEAHQYKKSRVLVISQIIPESLNAGLFVDFIWLVPRTIKNMENLQGKLR